MFAILRNWENESLLTVADVDAQQAVPMSRQSTEIFRTGRDIPNGFQLDLPARGKRGNSEWPTTGGFGGIRHRYRRKLRPLF